MNRTELLNEFEMILTEYILAEDTLVLENKSDDSDILNPYPVHCKCKRTCGRENCDDLNMKPPKVPNL